METKKPNIQFSSFPQFIPPDFLATDVESLTHEYLHYLLFTHVSEEACTRLDRLVCNSNLTCDVCPKASSCLAYKLSKQLGVKFDVHGIGGMM